MIRKFGEGLSPEFDQCAVHVVRSFATSDPGGQMTFSSWNHSPGISVALLAAASILLTGCGDFLGSGRHEFLTPGR